MFVKKNSGWFSLIVSGRTKHLYFCFIKNIIFKMNYFIYLFFSEMIGLYFSLIMFVLLLLFCICRGFYCTKLKEDKSHIYKQAVF